MKTFFLVVLFRKEFLYNSVFVFANIMMLRQGSCYSFQVRLLLFMSVEFRITEGILDAVHSIRFTT